MTEKTSTLKVVVDPSGAESGAARAGAAIDSMAKSAEKLKKYVGDATDQLKGMVSAVQAPLNSLRNLLSTVFSVEAIVTFGRELYNVNSVVQGFTATMMVSLGSQRAAAREFEFVTEVANKYGVSVESLTKTYAKLVAAGKDSNMTMQDMHKVFEAMAMASNVLHLTTEETRLVFYALQQMVSKGNVSMEELRRQLAEKFPGAVNLASEAMNVTVKELEKMIRTGNLAAEDMLPKLADVIMKAFGPASQYSMHSLNAEMARLHNSWFLLVKTIGENGVVEAAGKAAQSLATHLNDGSNGAAIFGQAMARLINQFTEWSKKITAGDIEQFFTTISNLVDALLPPLKLVGMIISGWAAILGPIVETLSKLIKDVTSGNLVAIAALSGNPAAIAFWNDYRKQVDAATESTKNLNAATAASPQGVSTKDSNEKPYGRSPEQQLADSEAAYRASLRNIEVKSKERNATQELADMEAYRAALLRSANNEEVPIESRVAAFKTLASQEKEYLALKKETNEELRQSEKAYNAIYQPIENYIRKLDNETDRLTLSQSQIHALNLEIMLQGVAKKDLAGVTARLTEAQDRWNAAQKYDQHRKEMEALQKEQESYLKSIEDAITKQQKENDTIGLTKQQLREYEIAKLEATLASKMMSETLQDGIMYGTKEAETLLKQIDALKKLIALKKKGNAKATEDEALNAALKEQQKLVDAWDKTNDKIASGLTDALFRGFESGKDFAEIFRNELVQMFKTLVLRPIIQPIMGDITGLIRTALGFGMGGNKSMLDPTGDGSGLLGNILNAASMYTTGSKLLGGTGLFAQFGQGFTAGFTGTPIVGEGAMVWQGYTGAATTTQSVGQTLGQYTAAAAPYVAALMAVLTTYDQYKKWGNDNTGKAGVLGGAGAGGTIGFMIGGPIGAAIGAALGAITGGRLFGRGPVHQDANGIMGTVSGQSFSGQNWQDLSQKGGLFRSDKRWTEYSAMTSDQLDGFNNIMKAYRDVLDNIGKMLGVDAAKLLESFSAEFKITIKDRNPEDVQKDINDFFDKVFRDQLGLVLSGQSDQLKGYIDQFTGTTAELIDFATALVAVAVAIPKMDIKGLSFDSLDKMSASGENIVQTFTRVTTGFNLINSVYKTEIEKTNDATLAISQAFATLNVAMPRNQVEWETLAKSIDLSTDAGRALFDVMVSVAPTFKQLTDAAMTMMNTIRGQLTQVYGGQLAVTFAQQAFDAAANAWNAWGIQNFGWTGTSAQATFNAFMSGQNANEIADVTDPTSANYWGPEAASLMSTLLSAFLALRQAMQQNNSAVNSNTTSTNTNTNIQIQTSNRLQELRNGLLQYMRGLLTDQNLSPLNPEQRFLESYNQFNAAYTLAKSGGPGSELAMASLERLSDQTLQYARDIYASSPAYTEIFSDIFSKLGEVVGPGAPNFYDAWTAALPENSTLASAADVEVLSGKVNDLIDVVRGGIAVTDDRGRQAIEDLITTIRTTGQTKL